MVWTWARAAPGAEPRAITNATGRSEQWQRDSQQIDQLERGNLLHLPPPWSRSPQQILANLRELVTPEGWLLMEDDTVLDRRNLSTDDLPVWPRRPGFWLHDSP